jgi:glycerophosphoryl diester phosphodiesterase
MRIVVRCYLILLLFLLAYHVSADVWPEGRPVYVSHRGANREADENTLKAYAIAAEYGMDFIECDPRLTRDRVFVIMHDATVDRTTNGHGRVKDMTLEEIKALRTAHGEQVPTLREVLELARDRELGIYLDIKVFTPESLELMLELLDEYDMADKVFMGFYKRAGVKYIEEKRPEIVTDPAWPLAVITLKQAERLGADFVGTLSQFATRRMVKRAHRHGLKVITMPVNDPEKIEKQRSIGLDAIQTDLPELLCLPGNSSSLD